MTTLRDHLIDKCRRGQLDTFCALLSHNSDGIASDTLEGFLEGLGVASPFLGRILSDQSRLERILTVPDLAGLRALFDAPAGPATRDQIIRRLRLARNETLAAIALFDLGLGHSVAEITGALSDFADRAIAEALGWAYRDECAKRRLSPPSSPLGLSIIGMGKLGARELNYSSDIDLIAIYDPAALPDDIGDEAKKKAFCIRVVQTLVDLLSQQTRDGFVFRCDLRLRPNPSATPVAVSLASAELYYQTYGQNWERAAFIKARHIAGDDETGAQFLASMVPFIWRRTLDYHAVADIHAIKKQIHAEQGRPDLCVPGADVKLGPGGIREIEFFAQTQQLLLGGRDPSLRTPRTVNALGALAAAGHILPATVERLTDAYQWLRRVEHCLQLRQDQQTQTLPDDESGLTLVAAMMGFDTPEAFESHTLEIFHFVHDTYAALFPVPDDSTPLSGSLVFTGVELDPRTEKTLRSLGFEDPERVYTAVAQWHRGGLRATKSVRARQLLTALVPRLLTEVGTHSDPDSVFAELDLFLTNLPAGLQYFSLFTAEPQVLTDVIQLCAVAPEIVRDLSKRPPLIEAFIEGAITTVPDWEEGRPGDVLEQHMDRVRRIVQEHRTRTRYALALGRVDHRTAGEQLSAVADRSIKDLTQAVAVDMVGPDSASDLLSRLAILSFGRLGMRTLTTASDLDLIFIYEGGQDDAALFARLSRRIVTALSVPTSLGELYDIDMQLRPSGGAGPTAVSLNAFRRYYQENAWVWELLALSKARVIGTSPVLEEHINGTISNALNQPRDKNRVRGHLSEMRQRLQQEKAPRHWFDVKRLPGGLTDIEFGVFGLGLLTQDQEGRRPSNVYDALDNMAGYSALSRADVLTLKSAYDYFEGIIFALRAVHGLIPPTTLSPTTRSVIERVKEDQIPISLEDRIEGLSAQTKVIIDNILNTP